MKSKTYEEFVEKFKPKLTTDDCITPPSVYEAIKDWACEEYNIDPRCIVRPFWPVADYTAIEYRKGCVVLDNPPFSIYSKICEYYLDRDIKFFLFAPTLTVFSGKNVCMRINHIVCGAEIIYENGASVSTSFVTNLGDNEIIARTSPKLTEVINDAMKKVKEGAVRVLPKYEYPNHIVTAAMIGKYGKRGIDFKVKRSDCVRVSALDAQKEYKKSIFGGGLLLSDSAAAEKAAAEKAAAEKAANIVWELSEREKEIISKLGN